MESYTAYELTLTLRPSMYRLNPQEQFDKCFPILRKLTDTYCISIIAELTQENNVHFHCLVNLKDFVHRDKFLNVFRKYNNIFGRKTCTQLVDYYKWTKYMIKDVVQTSLIVTDPIVSNMHDLFRPKFVEM